MLLRFLMFVVPLVSVFAVGYGVGRAGKKRAIKGAKVAALEVVQESRKLLHLPPHVADSDTVMQLEVVCQRDLLDSAISKYERDAL